MSETACNCGLNCQMRPECLDAGVHDGSWRVWEDESARLPDNGWFRSPVILAPFLCDQQARGIRRRDTYTRLMTKRWSRFELVWDWTAYLPRNAERYIAEASVNDRENAL